MREIAISIGGFHETTEDTDYGTLWADTAEDGLTLATAVTDGFLHTMASTSHTRRIKRTKEPKSEVLQEEQIVPIPYLKRECQASVTHSSLKHAVHRWPQPNSSQNKEGDMGFHVRMKKENKAHSEAK